jgi:hypothetical protein
VGSEFGELEALNMLTYEFTSEIAYHPLPTSPLLVQLGSGYGMYRTTWVMIIKPSVERVENALDG